MKTVRSILSGVDWRIAPSQTAEEILAALEQRIGRKLPAVFRELWSSDNGPEFLARYSNQDRPISPSGLAEPSLRWPGYDPLADEVLPFMIENQNICAWGIKLDGDDPPVVVEVDSGTPPNWRECADSFSDWLACQVYDTQLLDSRWFAAQGPTLTETVLALLYDRFEAGKQTSSWPGGWNYRFENERAQLLLWNSDGQCDWWIAPRSPEHAASALDEIEAIAGIGRSLTAQKPKYNDVLRAWRDQTG